MDKELKDIIQGIAFEKIEKHPNILIAARFWEDERFNAAKTCYGFMRTIDDMIDDRKARDEAITCMEQQVLTEKVRSWLACLDGASQEDPMIRELTSTVEKFSIPLVLFHNFARSMMYDVDHNGFSTFDEFLAYAEGASVAPASVFVHLCTLSRNGNAYIPAELNVIDVARPCALFSYIVHIIRDFQEDQLNNLNYFAGDILEKNGLSPGDLRQIAEGAPVSASFRNVIREYYEYAGDYRMQTLAELEKLAAQLKGRNLFSLHVIYQLYKQVYDRIDVEEGHFTTLELKPPASEIREKVMELAGNWKPVRKHT
jgi:phytoene synthase